MDIVQLMSSMGIDMPEYSPEDLQIIHDETAFLERQGIDWRAYTRRKAIEFKAAVLQKEYTSRDSDPDRLRPPTSEHDCEPQALKAWMAEYMAFYEQAANTSPLPVPSLPPSMAIERAQALRLQLEQRIQSVDPLTTPIPVKHPYRHSSSTPFRQLERLAFTDTVTHIVHEGCYILCRTIAPAGGRVPIILAVEDPEGSAISLMIYHFPTIANCSLRHLDAVFPVGTVLAIREPAYEPASQYPRLSVRVDSPTDIVFLSPTDEALLDIVWESDAQESSASFLPPTADEWKARGDAHFENGDWLPAAIAYSHGLAADPEAIALRLNRALAFSRLDYFSGAFADTELVYKASNATEVQKQKAFYHLAKAAYGRGQYEVAEGFFQEWQKSNPHNSEVAEWINRTRQRIIETRTGKYDWVALVKRAANNDPLDIGDYQGPIAVQALEHRGGGRGIVATEDVNVGTLLLVAKAFVAVDSRDLEGKEKSMFVDVAKGRLYSITLSELLMRTVQKIHGNPDFHSAFFGLYAGPDYPSPSPVYPPAAGPPAVDPLMSTVDIDIMKLENICKCNSFDSRTIKPFGDTSATEEPSKNLTFLLGSLFNHSCVPNATNFFIGETLVVRAAQKIKAGEEVMISYASYSSYLERTKTIKFQLPSGCPCQLCEMDRKDAMPALQKRDEALAKLLKTPFDTSLTSLQSLERSIEGTYSRPRAASRLELGIIQWRIARKLTLNKNMREAIKYDIQALKNIGFTVLDRKSKSLPIATSRVPTFWNFRGPATSMIQLCQHYLALKDKDSAAKWLRAARWYVSVVIAEGSDVFLYFAGPLLKRDPDLFAFAMQTPN